MTLIAHKLAWSDAARIALLGAALGLVACSPQEAPSDSTTETPEEVAQSAQPVATELREIPLPNLQAMESEVASLLDTSRAQLDAALADTTLDDSARAQAYADYGLVAFGNGLVIPAEVAFDNATRLASGDARWVYFLALIQESNGDLENAADNFKRVLQLRTDDIPSLIRLGNVRFEQAQLAAAATNYQRVIDLDGDNAAALYGLGRIASANDEHQQAVNYLERALTLQPQADQINYLLGLAWRNLGDKAKAQEYLARRGTNKPGFDDPLFDQISGGESRIGGMWADMDAGSLAFVDGDYSLAVEQFRKATQNHPDDSRAWQSLGMSLLKLRDPDGAEQAYNKALTLSTSNAVIHHELAKLKISTGKLSAAEQHLTDAIRIDPRMLDAHITQAKLLTDTGRLDDALASYETALKLDPQSADLAMSRADTLLALKRTDEATRVLAEAVASNPRNTNVRLSYGLTLAEQEKFGEARNQIDKALNDAADDSARARAHYAIGTLHLRQGDGQGAVDAFGNAVRLNPRHRGAGLALARTFTRLRDFDRALLSYEALLNYWPANDGARVEAAKLALMKGDGGRAKNLLSTGAQRQRASAGLLGSLARLLVLSTDPQVRDPEQAVALAQRALQLSQAAQHMETLALCQAAAGRFDEAVRIQQRILQQFRTQASPAVWRRMEKNLSSYQAGSLGRLPFEAF